MLCRCNRCSKGETSVLCTLIQQRPPGHWSGISCQEEKSVQKDCTGDQAKREKGHDWNQGLVAAKQQGSTATSPSFWPPKKHACECVCSGSSKWIIYIHISTTHFLTYRMYQIGYWKVWILSNYPNSVWQRTCNVCNFNDVILSFKVKLSSNSTFQNETF